MRASGSCPTESNFIRRLRQLAYNEFVDCGTREMHTVDYNLALLEPLGIRDAPTALKLELPRSRAIEPDETRRSSRSTSPFVIFHPGSARVEKFWEPERWAETIEYARTVLKLQRVLTGGNSALEQGTSLKSKANFQQPIVDLSGKIDLLTLAALIRKRARCHGRFRADASRRGHADAASRPLRSNESVSLASALEPVSILQGGSTAPVTEFSPDSPPFHEPHLDGSSDRCYECAAVGSGGAVHE